MIHDPQGTSNFFSMAELIIPIVGLVGSLTKVVVQHIENQEVKTLQMEMSKLHKAMDEISSKHNDILLQIKKETMNTQYFNVKERIKRQFSSFMEMMKAKPEDTKKKREEFKKIFEKEMLDDNLNTLFNSVIGTKMMFGKNILEVYMEDRQKMQCICNDLNHLFAIGLMALMGYAAILGNPAYEDELRSEWAEKMKKVKERMDQVLISCT
ncbi:protein rapunzel [Amia ocellicauda]|uniref:protein rapunzel n=1 Tax=Amia ocellicauda TaxID=2972642 RepID=UPI0034639B8B